MKEEVVVAIKHRDPFKEVMPYLDGNAPRKMMEVGLARSSTNNSPSRVGDGANGTVVKVVDRKRLKREVEISAEEVDERHRIAIGASPQIQSALNVPKRAAARPYPLSLLG